MGEERKPKEVWVYLIADKDLDLKSYLEENYGAKTKDALYFVWDLAKVQRGGKWAEYPEHVNVWHISFTHVRSPSGALWYAGVAYVPSEPDEAFTEPEVAAAFAEGRVIRVFPNPDPAIDLAFRVWLIAQRRAKEHHNALQEIRTIAEKMHDLWLSD